MVDVSIVNETSPEANWNGQTDRQADRRTGKPMCREAAPPKSSILRSLHDLKRDLDIYLMHRGSDKTARKSESNIF